MNIIRTRQWLFGSTALYSVARLAMVGITTGALAFASAAHAQGVPTGGNVVAGSATIATGAGSVTVNQASQATAINWDSFSVAQGNSVTFVQPDSQSVALNRVLGNDPSSILGNLTANGKVFLVNPNGVLFGQGAQVNVGGLVASTLNISDADFMAGRYAFAGTSGAAVLNRGTINAADGGFVALLGANVSNEGTIVARLGTVALAAGQGVTLDVAGDGLLNVMVDTGAVNGLVSNGGMIRADGGQVLLTAHAAGQLLRTAVNNTGVIEARTIASREGKIVLLGDMQSGSVNVDGVFDASAPNGGNGGFIETSASLINVKDSVRVTTAAATGTTGTWLIDPADFIIAPLGGNITGATLSAQLVTSSVVISTMAPDASGGNGDIFVNDAVAWTASGEPTTLTMNGFRDVNISAAITATNGNVVVCCGRDVNVNAPITTTNGSVLLNAGRDVHVFHAITTVDGNIALCAGHDVHIDAAVTLTRGTVIPAQSLGLPVGLTLIAGAAGTGPGVLGGTIIFAPLTPPVTVTVAPVTINYNPVSYAAPSDFSTSFVLTEGASLTQRMLLFPNGDKVFDGSTTTTLSGFNTNATSGLPSGVTLVAGPDATAVFDNAAVGSGVGITYSGYTLAGENAAQYALAGSCCVATFATTGTISPAIIVPPVVEPPVVVPPVVVPPVVVPPVVVPPVVEPPVVVPPVVEPPVVPPVVEPPVVVPPVVVPPVVEPPVVVPPVVVPPVVEPPVVVPPVIVPPVVEPPVVVPPVVVPPVVEPPVVVPPVVVPPVVEPPVVVPPVVVPPVVVPPLVEPPVVFPPVVVPPVVVPPVVVAPVVTPPVTEVPPVVVLPVVVPPLAELPPLAPQPTPVAVQPDTSILTGLTPVPAFAAAIPQFSVVGTGVNMPTVQLASVQPAPVQQAQDDRPAAGAERVGNAFLPAPAVPVYPRKQARH
ncbi:two-partner secretion domain-containing protein [Sphingomonas radiodurans]|uniref:two-partner secretion domain-containing protein n=1 Tax=Sphingomonas radiodurans TaxID=2890321 RepID=UPI001E4971E9|nr:filamentous hemagglutinin N-terminal domain-containing protein [Sphingomonas radiodurans]WBH18045.1 filamentous hemagglutinin N-terminal domain-containing protein [Sphingomonas radiodurans]